MRRGKHFYDQQNSSINLSSRTFSLLLKMLPSPMVYFSPFSETCLEWQFPPLFNIWLGSHTVLWFTPGEVRDMPYALHISVRQSVLSGGRDVTLLKMYFSHKVWVAAFGSRRKVTLFLFTDDIWVHRPGDMSTHSTMCVHACVLRASDELWVKRGQNILHKCSTNIPWASTAKH